MSRHVSDDRRQWVPFPIAGEYGWVSVLRAYNWIHIKWVGSDRHKGWIIESTEPHHVTYVLRRTAMSARTTHSGWSEVIAGTAPAELMALYNLSR
mgnify:CR=1 FL=1